MFIQWKRFFFPQESDVYYLHLKYTPYVAAIRIERIAEKNL